jgi:hypothetical protein
VEEVSRLGRGGRAVEGSGLENRQGRKSFVSSNLTHAAVHALRPVGAGRRPPRGHDASVSQMELAGELETFGGLLLVGLIWNG